MKFPIQFNHQNWISVRQRLLETEGYLLTQLRGTTKSETETAILRGRLQQIAEILSWENEMAASAIASMETAR